jgi:hypothetical protein
MCIVSTESSSTTTTAVASISFFISDTVDLAVPNVVSLGNSIVVTVGGELNDIVELVIAAAVVVIAVNVDVTDVRGAIGSVGTGVGIGVGERDDGPNVTAEGVALGVVEIGSVGDGVGTGVGNRVEIDELVDPGVGLKVGIGNMVCETADVGVGDRVVG